MIEIGIGFFPEPIIRNEIIRINNEVGSRYGLKQLLDSETNIPRVEIASLKTDNAEYIKRIKELQRLVPMCLSKRSFVFPHIGKIVQDQKSLYLKVDTTLGHLIMHHAMLHSFFGPAITPDLTADAAGDEIIQATGKKILNKFNTYIPLGQVMVRANEDEYSNDWSALCGEFAVQEAVIYQKNSIGGIERIIVKGKI